MNSQYDTGRNTGTSNTIDHTANHYSTSSTDPHIETINRLIREASVPLDSSQSLLTFDHGARFDGWCVLVAVEGVEFEYQFTRDDLQKVFQRYGRLSGVETLAPQAPYGRVWFMNRMDAERAISDLDNKVLNSIHGRLRVVWDPPSMQRMQDSLSPSMGGGLMPSTPPSVRKFTCRFDIGIENDKDFQVARRIIGQKGANMKRIVEATGAKLRLRGKGSGYLEGPLKEESNDPLHLCVSCITQKGYNDAINAVSEILQTVYEDYKKYRRVKGLPEIPALDVVVKETTLAGAPDRASTPPQDEFEYPSSPEHAVTTERRYDSGYWKVPT